MVSNGVYCILGLFPARHLPPALEKPLVGLGWDSLRLAVSYPFEPQGSQVGDHRLG